MSSQEIHGAPNRAASPCKTLDFPDAIPPVMATNFTWAFPFSRAHKRKGSGPLDPEPPFKMPRSTPVWSRGGRCSNRTGDVLVDRRTRRVDQAGRHEDGEILLLGHIRL